jgi:hypothetical protein
VGVGVAGAVDPALKGDEGSSEKVKDPKRNTLRFTKPMLCFRLRNKVPVLRARKVTLVSDEDESEKEKQMKYSGSSTSFLCCPMKVSLLSSMRRYLKRQRFTGPVISECFDGKIVENDLNNADHDGAFVGIGCLAENVEEASDVSNLEVASDVSNVNANCNEQPCVIVAELCDDIAEADQETNVFYSTIET